MCRPLRVLIRNALCYQMMTTISIIENWFYFLEILFLNYQWCRFSKLATKSWLTWPLEPLHSRPHPRKFTHQQNTPCTVVPTNRNTRYLIWHNSFGRRHFILMCSYHKIIIHSWAVHPYHSGIGFWYDVLMKVKYPEPWNSTNFGHNTNMFSIHEMFLKMSSASRMPFCLSLGVFIMPTLDVFHWAIGLTATAT